MYLIGKLRKRAQSANGALRGLLHAPDRFNLHILNLFRQNRAVLLVLAVVIPIPLVNLPKRHIKLLAESSQGPRGPMWVGHFVRQQEILAVRCFPFLGLVFVDEGFHVGKYFATLLFGTLLPLFDGKKFFRLNCRFLRWRERIRVKDVPGREIFRRIDLKVHRLLW